jgi:septum site-determining protein MinC
MSQDNLPLKGSMFPLTVLDLLEADFTDLAQQLEEKIAVAPDFFKGSAIIADCGLLAEDIDFLALKTAVDSTGMYLIGVSGLSETQMSAAREANLPQFKQLGKKRKLNETDLAKNSQIEPLDKTPKAPVESKDKTSSPANSSTLSPQVVEIEKEVIRVIETDYKPPKIYEGTVRGGQRLYAENRDLIIIGNVSHGAEVIADGNIHIYGTLRGRALAGAQGDITAIICTQRIEAQLVSIAGYYKVLEDVKEYASLGAIKVHLQDTSLKFKPIDQA